MDGMRGIPRDVQLEIVKGIGLDGLRALGVRPGRLRVPPALAAALASTFSFRLERRDGNCDWASTSVHLRVPGTDKRYMLSRRSDDTARGIEHTVELYCVPPGAPSAWTAIESVMMYRSCRAPYVCLCASASASLIDLSLRSWRGPAAALSSPSRGTHRA